jgi:hypothetical protein
LPLPSSCSASKRSFSASSVNSPSSRSRIRSRKNWQHSPTSVTSNYVTQRDAVLVPPMVRLTSYSSDDR